MKIEHDITIDSPVNRVFDMIADTRTLPEYIPSMMEVRNIKGQGVGRTYDWTFKLVGIPFKGSTKVMEFDKNRKIVTRSEEGIASTWTWRFEEAGKDHTKLTLEIEYKVPGKVLAKLTEPLLRNQNMREARLSLENLKQLVEARHLTAA